MNFTDFYFLCAFAVILVVYYTVPGKYQWGIIFVSNIIYYLLSGNPVLIIYPLLSITVVYICTRLITATEKVSRRKAVLVIGIILLLSVLIILKYLRFINISELLIPLGLSYYTFTLIGYMVDVYNGISKLQKNPLKLLAFGMYFPALVSGPIMQYREISESFFAKHAFDPKRVIYGLLRMLWGFFKKLIISERLGVIVSVMFSDPNTFGGFNVFIAILLFTIQLYSDFSGLMDIVLGMSQALGIFLPENFNAPFLAPTISEYWRRWHITLGLWFREYVFYPILRTKAYTSMQTKLKSKLGKRAGKQISTFIAMFILWLLVGLWHGGKMTFVLGSGLLHWFFIVMEESLKSPFSKLWQRLNINSDCKTLQFIRIIRTFLLVNIGNAFFRSASVTDALRMFRKSVNGSESIIPYLAGTLMKGLSERGIRAFSDVTIIGWNYVELGILIFSIILMLVVSLISILTKTDMRDRIARHTIPVRYTIWMLFLFFVILTAQYGPEYSSAEFIYQGF